MNLQNIILHGHRKLFPLWAEIKVIWRELTTEEQPMEVCERPYRSTDPTTKVATQLKWMLMKIYRPQLAFELRVTGQRPKSRMGYYAPAKRSITIHGGWGDVHSLEEIAIHEYAHHIHLRSIIAVARRTRLTARTSGVSTRLSWQKR